MRFSKDDLPAGSKVSVAVEVCAWYEFRAEDILELSLEYEKMSGISFVTDGRLVLSRAAACASAEDGKRWREMSDPWLDEGEDESFWGNVMKGWCDVELLLFRTKEGERFFDCGTLLTEDAGEGGDGGFSAETTKRAISSCCSASPPVKRSMSPTPTAATSRASTPVFPIFRERCALPSGLSPTSGMPRGCLPGRTASRSRGASSTSGIGERASPSPSAA